MIKAARLVEAGKELLVYAKERMIPYVKSGMALAGMDCQGLCEYLLIQCGLSKADVNLAGSNAHWRQSCRWRGSVEEAVALFGNIPDGAWLFIHAYDGGEPDQYKGDGQGNAYHVGQYLGDLVAVHASQGRGFVAESAVKRKSINGGWNAVALPKWVQFSEKVEGILAGLNGGNQAVPEMSEEEYFQEAPGAESEPEAPSAAKPYSPAMPGAGEAIVNTEADELLLRKKPSKTAAVIDGMPKGAIVTVLEHYGADWTRVRFYSEKGTMHEGWCATRYLLFG